MPKKTYGTTPVQLARTLLKMHYEKQEQEELERRQASSSPQQVNQQGKQQRTD
jgi:hypothetical protein